MTDRPDFPKSIDSSARKAFASCPMLFYYEYMLHLKPKGVNINLHFGGCFARGLEIVRKEFYGKKSTFEHSIAKGTEALLKAWGDFEPEGETKKTLDACIDCLYDYFVQYPPADDPVKPLIIDGEPTVEFSFAIPIPDSKHPQTGEPILYTGRFDMMAEYNGAVFIDDEKTAAQLGKSWMNSQRMASQYTGYIWAAKSFGYEVMGGVIRGISPLKRGVNQVMLLIYRPNWMIERWLWQLNRDIARMIDCWESGEWDYNIDAACGNYGGCSFLEVCEDKNPSGLLSLEYEVNLWDPLEKSDD